MRQWMWQILITFTLIFSPRNAGLFDLVSSSQQPLAGCVSLPFGLALLRWFFGGSSRLSAVV